MHQQQTVVKINCMRCTEQNELTQQHAGIDLGGLLAMCPRCLLSDLVQGWCANADVYERLTVKGKPPTFFTLIVTQLVSGIWHGLFPGYVLFFISSALMFQSSKVLYRYERNWPKQVQNFPLWVVAKWAYTTFCLNYCASAFMVSCWVQSSC